jgi:hypothetical protein
MAANSDPEADALEAYIDRFDDSPPYWALSQPNVTQRLLDAIRAGRPLAADPVSARRKA